MPHARVVELAGLGHLMHEEAAAAVAEIVLPFLAAEL
jgi:pimeloyl-ACP methyl ester carboxylesterase